MKALELRVYGLVQGVGFRPFVARLAKRYGLAGWVLNEGGAVHILLKGTPPDLDCFETDLYQHKPGPAQIIHVEKREVPPEWISSGDFAIQESTGQAEKLVFLPPDLAVCPKCLAEMNSTADRRSQHALISCMLCGPRYTIIDRVPYDRENTSMNEFAICPECAQEYQAHNSRRFHAQTISCHHCGPELVFWAKDADKKDYRETSRGQAALKQAAEALLAGKIIAIKGIGGYHLACSPYKDQTVQALRELKGRETKPLALMCPDLPSIKKYCRVSSKEAQTLQSLEKPIVLVTKLNNPLGPVISNLVCQGSLDYGVFLPYTPTQVLLLERTGPLVMTSANLSGEPIIREDERIQELKNSELAGILTHQRSIRTGIDDSVLRCLGKETQVIRRARGYVPMPLLLDKVQLGWVAGSKINPQVLACGGMLKNTFCLVKDRFAYLSQDLGDLSDSRCYQEYGHNLHRLSQLLGVKPDLVSCDLHPDYPTTRYAQTLTTTPIYVQHHHAHIASVIAEHGLHEPVLGLAFDGTGYGADGKIWGGEFLICTAASYERVGQLRYVPILGGDSSLNDCRKTSAAYLFQAGLESLIQHPHKEVLMAAWRSGTQCLDSSSMGRLFDAVAALLGICQQASYEGEGPIRLEQAAVKWFTSTGQSAEILPYTVTSNSGVYQLDFLPLVRALAERVQAGSDAGRLAASFHYTIAVASAELSQQLCRERGLQTVALSGGVFQNRLLMQQLVSLLRKSGLKVFYNTKVPPNDGGISLGQALVALAIN